MPVVTPELEEKIVRRAKRAWRYHRRGEERAFSRITDVTDRTLKYRIPDTSGHGDGWYGSTKVLVRREKGEVIVEAPPRDSMGSCGSLSRRVTLEPAGPRELPTRTRQSSR